MKAAITNREHEILSLVAKGYTNKEIAKQLFIEPSTAKLHVQHLIDKLSASNRAHLVTLGFKKNLINLDA